MTVDEQLEAIIENIRHERLEQGYTQKELAQEAGISTSWVGHRESEEYTNDMRMSTFLRVCEALGLQPWDMFE